MTQKEIIEKFRNEALTAISFAEEQQTTKDETIISIVQNINKIADDLIEESK